MMKTQNSFGFCLAFCVLLIFTDVKAQFFELPKPLTESSINFELSKNLVIVPVFINHQGPYNFILDTGVNMMLITDTAIVSVKKLANLKTIKVAGLGKGDDIEAYLTTDITASLGRARAEHIQTAILRTDLLNLTSFTGIKISGLVGYTFFAKFKVTLNYSRKKMWFFTSNKKIKGQQIPLEINNSKPYINATLTLENMGKVDTKLLIDNGANFALSLESYDDKPISLPSRKIQANLGIGLNGEISGYIARIEEVKLGTFKFKNVITNFPNYSDVSQKAIITQRNGSIGADILRRFTPTFDYENGLLYLAKNHFYKDPFEHDMAGLEIFINFAGNKTFVVNRVEPDSPAAKAGILPMDEILSVNFVSPDHMTLDELTELLKFNENKTIFLELWRNNQTVYTLLKLKRRI